ncbi:MAG: hypothetical protein IJO32_07480 [Bacilli bacterium]|nr:hypothetical protein [Bacilli bacterium]
MKEATGELNMTVITVVVIAALGLIATTVVIPAVSTGIRNSTCESMLNQKGAKAFKSGSVYYCCPAGTAALNTSTCIKLEN